MDYINLGNTGLKVSRLSLGCMMFGSSKWRNWVLDEADARPVIKAALDAGIKARLGLESELVAVRQVRGVRKRDMKLNDACPHLTVDPQTYEVRADGELLTCEPATELPLAQRYHLF